MPEAERTIRILIADDMTLFRDAVRQLIEQEPDLRVVGEAANGRDALELSTRLKPDLLLLDLVMPHMPGMEVLRRLQGMNLDMRTIVLAAIIDPPQILEALKLGARGVVLKDAAEQLLFKSVRAVMAGEYWIGHTDVAGLVEHLKTVPGDGNGKAAQLLGLSRRELEITAAVVDGCTNGDIARKFKLSEQTVKHHLTRIFDKTHVSNRLELALFAIQNRLC